MHRLVALATSLVLGVATLVLVAAFASVATSPASFDTAGSSDLTVVERYYDAVNLMIASGNSEPLRQIFDPEAIDLEPAPAGLAGPEGLVRYLQALRGTLPGISIEPGQLYSANDGIMAQPTVVGDVNASVLGISIDRRQRIWPEVERFHVIHGRIVERSFKWSGLALVEPLLTDDAAIAIAPRREVEAGILVLPPRATMDDIATETTETLRPLTDGILFRLLSPISTSPAVARSASPEGQVSTHFIAPGDAENLAPGQVVTVPPGSAYSVSNERSTPAELFVLSVAVALSTADAVSPESPLPFDGFEVQSLVNIESNPDDDWRVESGHVWLMPGAGIRIDSQTRMMAICEVGSAMRCLIWLPEIDPLTPEAGPQPIGEKASNVFLSRSGAEDKMTNPGEDAVQLWVFSVG